MLGNIRSPRISASGTLLGPQDLHNETLQRRNRYWIRRLAYLRMAVFLGTRPVSAPINDSKCIPSRNDPYGRRARTNSLSNARELSDS
jgi:hypothetical protein